MVFSKKLIEKLKLVANDDCEVELAMRYGNPNMEEALLSLKNKNCRKLIVLPMFPQYSGTTTGSIFDEVTRILSKWRWVPSLNFINSYHDNDYYINALYPNKYDPKLYVLLRIFRNMAFTQAQ